MGRRSISQRILTAGSAEAKRATAIEWADNWQTEHERLIQVLERAIRTDDYDLLCRTTGQLKAVGQKRFEALPKVLLHLIGDSD